MSKQKRNNRKQTAKTTPMWSKKAPQNNSPLNRIKQNWPIWTISALMACSLVGRFAGSSARQAARTKASQPSSVTATAPAQARSTTTTPAQTGAKATITASEDFSGKLTIQDESESNRQVTYHLNLPTSWHSKIETAVQANVVSFIYDLDSTQKIPLFTLAAYSDTAWKKLQTEAGDPGQTLLNQDGVVIVDEIVLDQTNADQTPELKTVLNELPQILTSFTAKPTS